MKNGLSLAILCGLLLVMGAGWLTVAWCSQPPTTAVAPPKQAPRWVRTADGWERAWWLHRRPPQWHQPPLHPLVPTLGIACAALAALIGSKRFSLD